MSTISVAIGVTETSRSNRRPLFSSSFAIPDVDESSVTKVKLDRGESITLNIDKLLICSVNIEILIQIEVDSETLTLPFSSSMVLPVKDGTVTITNPSDNSVIIPAVVSYVAI